MLGYILEQFYSSVVGLVLQHEALFNLEKKTLKMNNTRRATEELMRVVTSLIKALWKNILM